MLCLSHSRDHEGSRTLSNSVTSCRAHRYTTRPWSPWRDSNPHPFAYKAIALSIGATRAIGRLTDPPETVRKLDTGYLLADTKTVLGRQEQAAGLTTCPTTQCGWQDSNLRPPGPKPGALNQTELHPLTTYSTSSPTSRATRIRLTDDVPVKTGARRSCFHYFLPFF